MLSFRTIVPHTLELLKYLMAEPYLENCRFVGGTALALQYGHRSSVDLDLFGDIPDDDLELLDILSQDNPKMFEKMDWIAVKETISKEVKNFDWRKYIDK